MDSAPDLRAAVNTVLASHGLRCISIEETQEFVGDGMPKLCERALDVTGGPADIQDVFYGAFKTRYMSAPAIKTKPMRGVRETLVTAEDAAFAMGVCTNKSEPVAETILNELQLMAFLLTMLGQSQTAH